MENITEKRKSRRIPVGIPAKIALIDENGAPLCSPVYVTLIDISNRGAKVSIGEDLSALIEVGTTIKIYLCFVKEKGEAVFNARVRWLRSIDETSLTAGVEYYNLSEENKDYLEYFISGSIENALHIKKHRHTRHIRKSRSIKIKKIAWITGAVLLGIIATFLLIHFFDSLEESGMGSREKREKAGFIKEMMLEKMKNMDKEEIKKISGHEK